MAARSAILSPIFTKNNRLLATNWSRMCVKFRRNPMKNATCSVFTNKQRKKETNIIHTKLINILGEMKFRQVMKAL